MRGDTRKRVNLDVPDDVMQAIELYRSGRLDEKGAPLTKQGAYLSLISQGLQAAGATAGVQVSPDTLYSALLDLRADVKGLGGALLLLIAAEMTPEREGRITSEHEAYARSVLQRGRE